MKHISHISRGSGDGCSHNFMFDSAVQVPPNKALQLTHYSATTLGLIVVPTNGEDINGIIIKSIYQSILLGYSLRPKPGKVML